MDDHTTDIDDVGTEAEFEEYIRRLIRTAYENGVDFEGSWDIRNGKSLPDWEVMVHKLTKQGGD